MHAREKRNQARRRSQAKDPIARAGTEADIISQLLRSVPVIDGESQTQYHAFVEQCRADIKPRDTMEEIWLADFTEYSWSLLHLKRLNRTFMLLSRTEALKHILDIFLPYESDGGTGDAQPGAESVPAALQQSRRENAAARLAIAWSRTDEAARNQVDALFREHGITMDWVMAQVLDLKLHTMNDLDRLIAAREMRRDKALRNIDERRAMQLKQSGFIETECEDVSHDTQGDGHVAQP